MTTTLDQRAPMAKAGRLIGLLMLVWLAFRFISCSRQEPAPLPLAPIIVKPLSKLQTVGLPNNVDFEGLPAFFAVRADGAEWKDGRTRFAYWHPGAHDYAYFFEAVRTNEGFRFKEIPEPKDEDIILDENLPELFPIRLYHSFPTIKLVIPMTNPAHDPIP